MLYLLNAFSTTMLPEGGIVEFSNLTYPEEATDLLQGREFISAIGHAGTAEVFSRLLQLPVEPNRIQITLQPGDWAVVGQINTRLPEGKVLSADKLQALPIRWVLVHVKPL